jgi:hypothetical protein
MFIKVVSPGYWAQISSIMSLTPPIEAFFGQAMDGFADWHGPVP